MLAGVTFWLLPSEYHQAGEVIEFTAAGRATLAVTVWMALWWLSEAVPVAATALLPVALFPLFGAADIRAATAPYASDLVFLFMGGFILALSMQRWGLDKRIALITVRIVGTRPQRMVAGVMLSTAMMSAFVSNTATVAMMLPIVLSLVEIAQTKQGAAPALSAQSTRNFSLCLLLGVAYAASIGGVATIIGTPPNVYLVGFIKGGIDEAYRSEISFVKWMLVGVPFSAVFLPLTWLLLTRVLHPIRDHRLPGADELVERQYRELGAPSRAEMATFVVFCITALTWILRPYLQGLTLNIAAVELRPFAGLSDAGIAIAAALVLFVLPSARGGEFVMNWDTAKRLPWGVLVLFGGGLSLAAAIASNGVGEFIGAQAAALGGWPPFVVVIVVIAIVVFMTELTSNTATTATLVPILAALAIGVGLHPYTLIVPVAMAASCAFMMPVATPPNAIVFGSGYVSIPQMCRAGLWLNLVGLALIAGFAYSVVPAVLGFRSVVT